MEMRKRKCGQEVKKKTRHGGALSGKDLCEFKASLGSTETLP